MAEKTLLPPPATTLPDCGEEAPAEETGPLPLAEQLDLLLERYLELVDTYTRLRTQLSQSFSAGFFSLAQANRHCTLGPGRRYGPDGYDERMKSSRRVRVRERLACEGNSWKDLGMIEGGGEEEQEELQRLEGEAVLLEAGGETVVEYIIETVDAQPLERGDAGAHNEAIYPPPATPPSDETLLSHSNNSSADTTTATSPPDQNPQSDTTTRLASLEPALTRPRDPLYWYGILVPPALRAAQTHFGSAVTKSVPSLLGAATEMAALEGRIAGLRAQLQLGLGSAVDDGQAATIQRQEQELELELEGDDGPKVDTSSPSASGLSAPKSTSAKSKSKSKRQNLADRTVSSATDAPRSRLLKLNG